MSTLEMIDRSDLVTARQTIQRAVDGAEDADLARAASLVDRGRVLVTCPECGVSWYRAEVA